MGAPCRPGLDLLNHLQVALAEAGAVLSDEFVLEGSVCMAGCTRPCTVSFQATAKATYLFGDIGDGGDIEALVSFARLYRDRADGMTRAGERPKALGDKTLARVPAAILSSERRSVPLQ
jgi:predicted metal-binding protein